MKRWLTILFSVLTVSVFAQLPMGGWKMHYSYNAVKQVEQSARRVYALCEGSLYTVDKEDGEISFYNKLTGLNGANIVRIKYAEQQKALIILYGDGNIDLLYDNDDIDNIVDLYITQSSVNKAVNDVVVNGAKAYLAMDFGILVVNLEKKEISETYYIGPDATAIPIQSITIKHDSLYALSDDVLYAVCMKDNMVDYSYWKTRSLLPGSGQATHIEATNEYLYLLRDSLLYRQKDNLTWQPLLKEAKLTHLRSQQNQLLATSTWSNYVIDDENGVDTINIFYYAFDILYDASYHNYWFAYGANGLGKFITETNTFDMYNPSGPLVNIPYRMRIFGDKLYVLPGGRWAVQYSRAGNVMMYENGEWENIRYEQIVEKTGTEAFDFMNVAVDPKDANHFYVTSYGTGLYEFRNNELVRRLTGENSNIASSNTDYDHYTRLDGAIYDENNYLWFMSAGGKEANLFVMENNTTIYQLNLKDAQGYKQTIYTPMELIIDSRNSNHKWIVMGRYMPCVALFDDNGTPLTATDDKTYIRKTFQDQRGSEITPLAYYSVAQDLEGSLWIGTDDGIIIIPSSTDFRTSNACERMIIYRTDGSSLGDYLLTGEKINAIAVDGANRKWIGTETSGVYLFEETTDVNGLRTVEEIHHFISDNSPLPSNNILSIAIHPRTGEVFMGTDAGLVSYQSNATEAAEDLSNVYAYPNPVREDFIGLITIAGLMDNSTINITDVHGELVARTSSLGGTATWDGCDGRGVRVRTGVYMAQCVSQDGKQYALVKILVVN